MTRKSQLAKIAERETDFIRRIAEGESVADAAAVTGLTEAQAYEYLRNPMVAGRIRETATARIDALLIPAAVNSLLRLMDPSNDVDQKRSAAQARAAATLVLGAMRQPVGRPTKTAPGGPKSFEEMTPDELERHLATLKVAEGEAKAVE